MTKGWLKPGSRSTRRKAQASHRHRPPQRCRPPRSLLIRSDDRLLELQFDALPWFEQATDQAILLSADVAGAETIPLTKWPSALPRACPALDGFSPTSRSSPTIPRRRIATDLNAGSMRPAHWNGSKRHRNAVWSALTVNKPYSVLLLNPDEINDWGNETYYAFVESARSPCRRSPVARRRPLTPRRSKSTIPTDLPCCW